MFVTSLLRGLTTIIPKSLCKNLPFETIENQVKAHFKGNYECNVPPWIV
jgi:hypothetical protein